MNNPHTLKCPNCGATTNNTHNCEYCGSLLVRFIENEIDVQNYVSTHGILPGLKKALDDNIVMQNNNADDIVVTDIFGKYYGIKNYCYASVIPTQKLVFHDGTYAFPTAKSGISISFCFDISNNDDDKNDIKARESHEKFKSLPISKMFTYHRTKDKLLGMDCSEYYEYAIDFGNDTEGAARLISSCLNEVYGVPYDMQLEYYTNINSKIDEIRKRLLNENTVFTSTNVAITTLLIFSIIKWLIAPALNSTIDGIVPHIVVLVCSLIFSLAILDKIENNKREKINKTKF